MMSEEFVILFNGKKCIQCHGCETACKSWRGVELGVKWRRVNNLWSGRYPRVKSTSLSVACVHCVDPACVKVCPTGAIEKRPDSGVVVVDRDGCDGCRNCLDACPFQIPQFGADGTMQKCDLCCSETEIAEGGPPCVVMCPTTALWYGKIDSQLKTVAEQSLKELLETHR